MRTRVAAACTLCLAAFLAASCGRPRREAARWQPREFLIALRGAPPQQPEHYAHAARAGFTAIADDAGPDALALARRHGLRLIVGRIGLDPETLADGAARERAAATLRRFRSHPALWGYFLGADVQQKQFEGIAAVAAFIRRHDPAHPAFISLLPCDAWVGPALENAHYAAYLERFLRTVRPDVLAYSHFPFREPRDSAQYFENLEWVRRFAVAQGLPFVPTLRGSQWEGMREPSEGSLRWLAHTSLAYGAKGVVWVRYWGGDGNGSEPIVTADGLLTERYRWVAGINAELRVLGRALLPLRSVAVYHAGAVPSGATRLPVHGLVGAAEGGAFVVGQFADDEQARYLFVANRDPRKAAVAKLTITEPCRGIAWLDPSTGRWCPMAAVVDRFQAIVEFPLRAGEGRLVRLPAAR